MMRTERSRIRLASLLALPLLIAAAGMLDPWDDALVHGVVGAIGGLVGFGLASTVRSAGHH